MYYKQAPTSPPFSLYGDNNSRMLVAPHTSLPSRWWSHPKKIINFIWAVKKTP